VTFAVTSPAFVDGAQVPIEFTCDGQDAAPPITVTHVPEGTSSFAIIMDDPDAPHGAFTHWLAYDVPADGSTLQPAAGKTLKNSFGRTGYGGPCPPPGHGTHRYYFRVYAVDVGALAVRGDTREALEAALKPHTLAAAHLMGRYERRR
jgi:Raf kinase inhibitor-like YbhB/YbcL family protein